MTTDPESILQLGIDAARDGDNEQARNLFRLLVSEDPQNIQAWLWLAGVAESREERQTALERVLEIDPTNEKALKGLQVLEGKSSFSLDDKSIKPPAKTESGPSLSKGGAPEPSLSKSAPPPDFDFDDPFAELDSLSQVFDEAPKAVVREVKSDKLDSASVTSGSSSSSDSLRTGKSTRKSTDVKPSRSSSSNKGGKKPMPKGIVRLFLFVLAVGVLFLGLWLVVWPRVFGKPEVVVIPIPAPAGKQQVADSVPSPTYPQSSATGEVVHVPATPVPEGVATEPAAPTTLPQEQPSVVQPAVLPTQPAAPVQFTDPVKANPQIIPQNTPQESNGWLYDYSLAGCMSSCVRKWYADFESFRPQGRLIFVRVLAENRTAKEQSFPPDFLIIKDAQGRVHNALPLISKAYAIPADLSLTDPMPADGITRSISLAYDIPIDATDLVLFAPSNAGYGWMIAQNVR